MAENLKVFNVKYIALSKTVSKISIIVLIDEQLVR
jgi:hypothetical protein